jgi:hypothetical protein
MSACANHRRSDSSLAGRSSRDQGRSPRLTVDSSALPHGDAQKPSALHTLPQTWGPNFPSAPRKQPGALENKSSPGAVRTVPQGHFQAVLGSFRSALENVSGASGDTQERATQHGRDHRDDSFAVVIGCASTAPKRVQVRGGSRAMVRATMTTTPHFFLADGGG